MQRYRFWSAISVVLVALLQTLPVHAQTLAQERAKLADMEAELTRLEAEQSALESELAKQIDALEAEKAKPSAERTELDDAKKALDEARAELALEASPTNQAKLKNAEFKYLLAERRYEKSNHSLSELSDQVETLEKRLADNQQRFEAVNGSLGAQRVKIDSLSQQQRVAEERALRERQQQALERSRAEAEAKQREIDRLQAQLADKQRREREAAAAAAAAKAATSAPAAPSVASTPAPAQVAAQVPAAASEPKTAGAQRLTSNAQVKTELARVDKLLAQPEDRKTSRVNRILHMKRLEGGKEVSKDTLSLKALGHDQFRAETEVSGGDYELVIGFNKWPASIPTSDSGATYIFLFDTSSETPRLLFFNSALAR